ncbi:MAG: hypothetical protein K0Q89_2312 [Thermomicrobiales bacterium]|jgi:hypothetical protein|nr:hypothetical protein [Thermomicrobiales bacterium]
MPISWKSPVAPGPIQAGRGHVVPDSPGSEWLLVYLLDLFPQRQLVAPSTSHIRSSAATVGNINSGGTSGTMIVG